MGAWNGSKAHQACMTAADGVDPAMGTCSRDEFDRQDKLLNAAYAAQIKAAGGRLKDAIRVSQRAWLAYRDSTCEAEGAVYEGGTMQPLTVAGCQARLTTERVEWLKTLAP